MPKLKMILYRICLCVIIIWLLAVAIWEYQINNHFGEIVLPLLALLITWQTIRSWHKTNWGWVANLTICIVCACFGILRIEYNDHQNKLRLDKFGPVLNAHRAKLGIPIIRVNWQPGYYSRRDVEWRAKDSAIGHQSKLIFLDSLLRLEFEEDDYTLKRAGKTDRDISIRTHYSKSGSVDSTAYTYEAGMNNKTISRNQADSIFKAEKIPKDY